MVAGPSVTIFYSISIVYSLFQVSHTYVTNLLNLLLKYLVWFPFFYLDLGSFIYQALSDAIGSTTLKYFYFKSGLLRYNLHAIVVVQSLCPTLSWTAARQASLSFTNSWSLLKLMSIGSMMPSLSPLFPHALNLSQCQGLFQWVGSLHQVAKLLEFWHQSFQWIFIGLISFRIDWFNLAVQGTLKSLLQHNSLKASILWHSVFFMVQLSHCTWLLEKP